MISNAKGHRDKDQDASLRLNNQEVMRGLCRTGGRGGSGIGRGLLAGRDGEVMCKQGTEMRITRCLFPKPGCKGGERNGSRSSSGKLQISRGGKHTWTSPATLQSGDSQGFKA